MYDTTAYNSTGVKCCKWLVHSVIWLDNEKLQAMPINQNEANTCAKACQYEDTLSQPSNIYKGYPYSCLFIETGPSYPPLTSKLSAIMDVSGVS